MIDDLKEVTRVYPCSVCEKEYSLRKPLFLHRDIYSKKPDWYCPKSNHHYEIGLRKKVDKIPRETRQKVLDLMHQGWKLGDVAKECNIELDCGLLILKDNISSVEYLRTEAI